jgi:hypothetical protein
MVDRELDWSACRELVRSMVSHPPSVFGQLVYVSSLRDKATGAYAHPAVCAVFGGDAADRVLGQQHQQIFQTWLALPLEQQCAELESFLQAIGSDGRLPHAWMEPSTGEPLIPETAEIHETQLFQSDLEMLLPMLQGDLQPGMARGEADVEPTSWFGRLRPKFNLFGKKTERKGVDSVLRGLPRRNTLLHRARRSEELKDLRDRGQISDPEFMTALNMLRQAEGLPPLPMNQPATGSADRSGNGQEV